MQGIAYQLKSKVKVKITGRKVEHFLKRLMASKIELLDIKTSRKELVVLIYKKDYEKLLELKSIYEVEVVDYKGLLKIRKMININKIIILFTIFGLALVLFLSNVIFKVEIIHTDKSIRTLLIKELSNYGIEPKKLKKVLKK